jgi:hypothetical protein
VSVGGGGSSYLNGIYSGTALFTKEMRMGVPVFQVIWPWGLRGISGSGGSERVNVVGEVELSRRTLAWLGPVATDYAERETLWGPEVGVGSDGLSILGVRISDPKETGYDSAWNWWEVRGTIATGVALNTGISIGQLIDFLVGWTGLDLAGDDWRDA